jgi:homoserine acetyltransferase
LPNPEPGTLQPVILEKLCSTNCNSFSSAAPDAAAKQADAYYDNYRLRDGEILARLRLHYATLGNPYRNSHGDIDNAVLVLHWTGSGGSPF